jgi:RNA polymerase sigma-70 factor, ECF subfamily
MPLAELPRIEDELERHRPDLTRYCTRILGSRPEGEDAVQETLVRAWRAQGQLATRSALRPWMYRIASNVCMTMLKARARRDVPIDPETLGLEILHAGPETDPAERAVAREAFQLALLATVERLPPRQRAVLFLRDVLDWRASEVAELLDTSTAAVNSALQRARTSLAAEAPSSARCPRGEARPAGGHVLAGRDRGHVTRRRAQPHQKRVEVASLD